MRKILFIAIIFVSILPISSAAENVNMDSDSIWNYCAKFKILDIRKIYKGFDTIYLIHMEIVGYDSSQIGPLHLAYGSGYKNKGYVGQKVIIVSDCAYDNGCSEKIKVGEIYQMCIFLLGKYWYVPGPPIKKWIINGIYINPRKLLYGQPMISPNIRGLCYDISYMGYPPHQMRLQLVTYD